MRNTMVHLSSKQQLAASKSPEDIVVERRWLTFNKSEYLAVPVVALVSGVVNPTNSLGYEFVPPNELAIFPEQWNNRPCTVGHPKQSSANTIRALESFQFGSIFETQFKDDRLGMTAYLDPKRAKQIGPGAVEIVERCEAGENIEVSAGVVVDIEKSPGTYRGRPYTYRWRNIIPDHLAFLPKEIGACSVAMGCGTNRHLSSNKQSQETIVMCDCKLCTKAKEKALDDIVTTVTIGSISDEVLARALSNSSYSYIRPKEQPSVYDAPDPWNIKSKNK